ncbi:hypothetical protein EUGRSUZ_D00190 [Eucalyptus grandis]|uniref:Uncharacterized protein n=2 Tax=Eucalyptus grandis TaxID=71139 RepID=A0ACC3L2F0_EUCGR|nr:hypothetical protein EUGRSUZ_D00190 [Eucalyptus grandis]
MPTLKGKGSKKKGGAMAPKRGNKKHSLNEDPFFSRQKRRRVDDDDGADEDDDGGDIIPSDASDEEEGGGGVAGEAEESEFDRETADEKRQRVAKEYLERIRAIARREKEDEDEGEEEEEEEEEDDVFGGRESDGVRDSLVSKILQQEQLEDSGRVQRRMASRVKKPEAIDNFHTLVKHRHSVTAVTLSEDDLRGFSASKDGTILHWDVSSGKSEKYVWPREETLRSHGTKDPQGRAKKHSKHVLALAVSSDGRYLASGGQDRHVHLWDTRTREHIQAFPGHRGPVSCLTYRQGTSELFSGSFDRTIKMWNTDDRAYISTSFGHQSEVLTIDCLRKERVLTVGRDRTMQLFKIPEETRIVFRAPASSLECCCFISNDEYLTGSDDGSVQLWSMLRKKPVYIVKNAHPFLPEDNKLDNRDSEKIANGHAENFKSNLENNHHSTAYSWVSSATVCRGSDLAASGAGNGYVRLWAIGSEKKDIQPLYDLPLVGFVNSLAFAKSGEFLVAAVGQELVH